MRILALADVESRYLWDFFEKSKLDGYDLILAAGDLAPQYLEFLVTYSKVPIFYVHGNHDGCYKDTPPLGCICVDDTIYEYQGLRIMGLGGSMCYNYSGFQYTEAQMKRRYLKLLPKMWHGFQYALCGKIRKAGSHFVILLLSEAAVVGNGQPGSIASFPGHFFVFLLEGDPRKRVSLLLKIIHPYIHQKGAVGVLSVSCPVAHSIGEPIPFG